MHDQIGSIFFIDESAYTTEVCATCGKTFRMLPGWVYKLPGAVFCRYNCMPKTGILNDPLIKTPAQKVDREDKRRRNWETRKKSHGYTDVTKCKDCNHMEFWHKMTWFKPKDGPGRGLCRVCYGQEYAKMQEGE